MAKDEAALATLPDPKVRALLTRLHRQADRERPLLQWQFLDQLPRLALAVRENGGGQVIGTEMVPSKAARAREHLREADLLDFVEIREGDAAETLRDLEAPVDLLLCDGFPPAMLPVLKLVAPRMRPSGVVVSDNVGAFWGDHRDFLNWVRDPANGFQSVMLAMKWGTELSVKLPPAGSSADAARMGSTSCAS